MSYIGNKANYHIIESGQNKLIQFNRVLTAGQTVIDNLTFVSGTEMVYINGVLLQQGDYSANGTTVTLSEPATEGDSFRLVGAGNYDLNSGAAGIIYDNAANNLDDDSVQGAIDSIMAGGNFSSMPLVAGDPIVEEGSNANGNYVRFASGLQICVYFASSNVDCNIAEGSIFISAEQVWTLPAAFVDVRGAQGTAGNLAWAVGFANHGAPGSSSLSFKLARATSGAASSPTYYAIGKWK